MSFLSKLRLMICPQIRQLPWYRQSLLKFLLSEEIRCSGTKVALPEAAGTCTVGSIANVMWLHSYRLVFPSHPVVCVVNNSSSCSFNVVIVVIFTLILLACTCMFIAMLEAFLSYVTLL